MKSEKLRMKSEEWKMARDKAKIADNNIFLFYLFFCKSPYGGFLVLAPCSCLCYTLPMSVTQTVEIPASHRLTIDVPREVPAGRTILAFIPAPDQRAADTAAEASPPYAEDRIVEDRLAAILSGSAPLPGGNARTIEEAKRMAAEKAADPNRLPLSRLFGTCKGIFGGDGVAYQRAIRDEWDD